MHSGPCWSSAWRHLQLPAERQQEMLDPWLVSAPHRKQGWGAVGWGGHCWGSGHSWWLHLGPAPQHSHCCDSFACAGQSSVCCGHQGQGHGAWPEQSCQWVSAAGTCSVPVFPASGLGSPELGTNHCLSPALPVSTELSQGCARGCDLCSEFNGCLRCSPKLFILLERNDIRQIGICLPSCPLGYFGLRNTDMNKCISECGAGGDRAWAGFSALQGSTCLCSGAGGAVAVWKDSGRAEPEKSSARHRRAVDVGSCRTSGQFCYMACQTGSL